MRQATAHLLVTGYFCLLGVLACYGVYRYRLLLLYYRVRSRRPQPTQALTEWPEVTIQIPVYNERYVVERAIQSACDVDYPVQRLEIQILDDSTDETSAIIAQAVQAAQQRGIRMQHLTRPERAHFKAGALAEGLAQARGTYVAVFDVDFVIPRDFLKRTLPFFADPSVGMVQARWGHTNVHYSWLTRAQAAFLDGHFLVEQVARHQSGRFFNFNGTAGLWRAEAIRTSGGWQTDTLTEDLDLSYRAQLAGWRCIYLANLVVPAELPVEVNAFKSQQYRWTRGSIQTAKKLLPRLLASPLPWSVKSEAFCHLASFFIYPIALLASLGLPLVVAGLLRVPSVWYVDLVWLALLSIPGAWFYGCVERQRHTSWRTCLLEVPWVLAVGMGMLANNSHAVWDGLWGREGVFVRTPKFGVQTKTDDWQQKVYRAPQTATRWLEVGLACYFAWGCGEAFAHRLWVTLLYLLLLCIGFGYVGWVSIRQRPVMPAWIVPSSGRGIPPLPELGT